MQMNKTSISLVSEFMLAQAQLTQKLMSVQVVHICNGMVLGTTVQRYGVIFSDSTSRSNEITMNMASQSSGSVKWLFSETMIV